MTGRWLVFQGAALGLLSAGVYAGVVQRALFADQTGIVWVLIALACVASCATRWRYLFSDWIVEHGLLILLGLLGTVVGFMQAITGVLADDSIVKMAGVDTALSTTAVGLVAHIYLLIMQRAMRK